MGKAFHLDAAAAFSAFLSVTTDGTFASLPDSSLNILQEKPATPCGCNSFPSIKTEGDPVSFSSAACSSLIR